MKVTLTMVEGETGWVEIVQCPWCLEFERHFVHLFGPDGMETVMCQWCVKQVAETILAQMQKADSQA